MIDIKDIYKNAIPEGWHAKPIKEFCNVKTTNISFNKIQSIASKKNRQAVKVFALKVSDMNLPGNETKFTRAMIEIYLDEENKLIDKLIQPGSVVFPKRGAAIATNKKRYLEDYALLDPNLIAVEPFENSINPLYLYYYFLNLDLASIQDNSTLPQLNKKDIDPLHVIMPVNEDEQNKIVHVLSTLQKAIQKQDEIIAKTQLLKKSLLNKLFTEGSKGEQLKQTEIGFVPKSWRVVPLGDEIKFLGGYAFKSSEVVKNGSSTTQLVRMGNLYQNKLDLKRSPTYYPNTFSETYSRFLLKPGDLIISLTGTMGKEDYGFTVEVPKVEAKLLLNQRIGKLIFNEEKLEKDYVRCFMLSRRFLDMLYPTAQGTKQANLSTNAIQKLPFLIPEKSEQRLIGFSILTIERKIRIAESKRNTLYHLFKTLLNELMTGLSRINDTNFHSELSTADAKQNSSKTVVV